MTLAQSSFDGAEDFRAGLGMRQIQEVLTTNLRAQSYSLLQILRDDRTPSHLFGDLYPQGLTHLLVSGEHGTFP